MAAIDKIYGSTEQYDEFLAWAQANKPTLARYFYPRDGYEHPEDRPITNFPTECDVWLWKHCPIDWVKGAIAEQYNGEPSLEPKRPARLAYGFEVRPWNMSRRQWNRRQR